ncbi:MAG TPA: Tim44/TimA family putative adaptor protein [Rhizobiales bacterium]|nr:Tim44/TimA family putative adaptor protein [Hyphomicrobiales bacterium]
MQEILDPFNLIIIAIAVVIFLRLRNVLGRRNGQEKRPYDPFTKPDHPDTDAQNSNVIPLPTNPPAAADRSMDRQDKASPWNGEGEENSPLNQTLHDIARADPEFEPERFLSGAKMAYEMIVQAFAQGDLDTLKSLLSDEVFAGFENSIRNREKQGATMQSEFIGIDKAVIVDAEKNGNEARVTVKFVSELIQFTKDREGKVIEGEPDVVREVVDIWTFARDVTSRDPNWKLDATESAN